VSPVSGGRERGRPTDGTGERPRPGRLRKIARTVAIVAVPLGLLVAAALVARHLWRGVGDTAIGAGGLAILLVGGLVTLALGAVLIFLMIVSGRRGYDDGERPRCRSGG
jgi:hypothetical protein